LVFTERMTGSDNDFSDAFETSNQDPIAGIPVHLAEGKTHHASYPFGIHGEDDRL